MTRCLCSKFVGRITEKGIIEMKSGYKSLLIYGAAAAGVVLFLCAVAGVLSAVYATPATIALVLLIVALTREPPLK